MFFHIWRSGAPTEGSRAQIGLDCSRESPNQRSREQYAAFRSRGTHTILLHGMAGSVDRTALSGNFSTEWPVRWTERLCLGTSPLNGGSVDGTALSGDFSTEWPVRWTERLCLGTYPRNGRFGGQNGFVWELLHRMAGSMDGTGLGW